MTVVRPEKQIQTGYNLVLANSVLDKAAEQARQATCLRRRCGAILTYTGSGADIIGYGFNSPAHHDEANRRCGLDKHQYHEKVTDKTCCVHAEARAILMAVQRCPRLFHESTMWFCAVDLDGNRIPSGDPLLHQLLQVGPGGRGGPLGPAAPRWSVPLHCPALP
jgi:hypothetical protein